MTPEQCDQLVRRVHIAWGANLNGKPLLEVQELWRPFLIDLEYKDVYRAIDELIVLSGRFMPRVGEIRRRAMDIANPDLRPPSPIDAWVKALRAQEAASQGTQSPRLHPCIVRTMRRVKGLGMVTNSDRQAFVDAYSNDLEAYILETYGTS